MSAASRFRRTLAGSLAPLLWAVATGCGIVTAPTRDAPPTPADLSYCVDQTNALRATVGLPPLARSHELENFAAAAARYDATAGSPHVYFRQTQGSGVSRAEIELLGWHDFTIHQTIDQGLGQMWEAGPGSEHYDILAGPYSQIGCGIFVNGSTVTVAQDFR